MRVFAVQVEDDGNTPIASRDEVIDLIVEGREGARFAELRTDNLLDVLEGLAFQELVRAGFSFDVRGYGEHYRLHTKDARNDAPMTGARVSGFAFLQRHGASSGALEGVPLTSPIVVTFP